MSPVAPFVGVWIEIHFGMDNRTHEGVSLPSWECGLKSEYSGYPTSYRRRSLRGSVD